MERTVKSRVALPPREPPTDEQLLLRFRDGESSAFDELLDRHRRAVYGYLLRSTRSAADADDLFQEVFLKVIRAAATWEPRAKVTTWIYAIARNTLIDAARRRAARPRPASLDDPGGDDRQAPIERLPDLRPLPDQELLTSEHLGAVEALLETLPEEQREAFLLKREGLTFEQIAEVSAVSKNTVKSRLRYALEKLRTGLAARGLLAPREQP